MAKKKTAGTGVPNADRNRKMATFTLSPEALDHLRALAEARSLAEERNVSRSEVLDKLIRQAPLAPLAGRVRRKRSEIVR